LNALKTVYRYLLATKDLTLFFQAETGVELSAETDASWGTCSFSGYLIKVGNNPIVWKVRKQRMVAMSSCEAELLAMVDCAKEIVWARGFLQELCYFGKTLPATLVETDSQSAIAILATVGMHGRSRHYRRQIVFLQSLMGDLKIALKYRDGKSLASDLLTKPINGNVWKKRRNEFNLLPFIGEAVGT
jgi:hypothetical protein